VVERRKASAPCKARAASQDAEVADLRLSAFRFLLFLSFFAGLRNMIVTAAGSTADAF
jgi:hypothetical protein